MLNDEYMENRGKYKDRIDTELDIYFDGNYEVAGGLGRSTYHGAAGQEVCEGKFCMGCHDRKI